ncbi:hypothetical protein [Ancylobacter terrae]|uniref:hypothetical protein n=1 Tax=Ancylobacter sp. sgz301288 TaxID=3342077 RepID=UPI0038599268
MIRYVTGPRPVDRGAAGWCRFAVLLLLLVVPAGPAAALTVREVGRVVEVMEKLRPHFGPLAYDETLADDWFARDAEERGLIVRAGFTQASWRAAFDATVCGYLATVPESAIDALFAELRNRLAHSPRLTAAQRDSIEEFVREERVRLDRLRRAGEADAEAVRPFADRLANLLPSPLIEP